MSNFLSELIRVSTREEASWAKTTALEILKIKNNYDAGNVTKENALSSLEALLSGVEELGPGSLNDRAVIDNGIEQLKKIV
jgi:hypothetical protein|tara:strand:- start:467 stop:709 length:243 start_codon:yes stop_codon:yes gene_type:complete